MQNHWVAEMKNGNIVTELGSQKWSDIENEIEGLHLDIPENNQRITLPKGYEYIQAKTASADLNGENTTIESRYVAIKIGNNIVKIRVDEKTNNISVEIE